VKDKKMCDEMIKDMETLEGFTEYVNKPDKKVLYKKEEGLDPITVYIEGTIKAPAINLIAVMAEIDLFKEWVPDTEISEIIKEVTPLRKSIYMVNTLPWPMWRRELFIEAGSYVLKEQKAIGVSIETIRTDTWFG